MFNRRLILLIIALGLALGILYWQWNTPAETSLEAASGPVSTARWEIDMAGEWKMYSSLRQAWTTESEQAEGNVKASRHLTGGSAGYLPSSKGFHVAAKTFRVPAEWNARTLILQLSGLKGRLTVYLNGIESINRVGTIESEAGTEHLEIPIKALHHGQDNLLFFELSAPPSQEQTILGASLPKEGKITGALSLQAVMETTLENPQVEVQWENEKANVQLQIQLNHHGFLEYGPWTVQGIVSDGSAEVVQTQQEISSDNNTVQTMSLNFSIPNARGWSPEDPYLYQLFLTVINPRGGKDNLALPIALSKVSFEQGGFHVQGKALTVKGLAIAPNTEYQLRGAGEIAAWLQETKDQGYNLVYFLGSFPDELWFQEADKSGMGIWAELPGNSMVPEQRLREASTWEGLVRSGSLHPSLWAYTMGKGLEINSNAALRSYNQEVQTLLAPIPAFNVNISQSAAAEAFYSAAGSGGKIQGDWGEIEFAEDSASQVSEQWSEEKWASGLWAVMTVIIAWANLATTSWRYKELSTLKPKRALRRAWFWHGVALLSRELTLAGVLTSLLFAAEVTWGSLIPEQWPILEAFKLQSPWLIWLILGLIFTLLRLLQVGVAAPHMPDSPQTYGLAVWLERRYFWNWLIPLLWAFQAWGIPRYIPLMAYLGLNIIFFPLRIRDVHRVGGKYAAFFWVPGIIIAAACFICVFRWQDGLYLWRLLQAVKIL